MDSMYSLAGLAPVLANFEIWGRGAMRGEAQAEKTESIVIQ